MEIIAVLFFEANTEDLVVQLATYARVTDDRTKARDEQHPDVSHFFHVIHYMVNPASTSRLRQAAVFKLTYDAQTAEVGTNQNRGLVGNLDTIGG